MFKEDIKYIERQINKIDNLDECLRKICFYLNKNIEGYDWVGFYFHNHKKKELNLIAFSGIPHKPKPPSIKVILLFTSAKASCTFFTFLLII